MTKQEISMVEISKPWQVRIDYRDDIGLFISKIASHTHASIAFSDIAVENSGGAKKVDEDGYTTECHDELRLVSIARHIAEMSEK